MVHVKFLNLEGNNLNKNKNIEEKFKIDWDNLSMQVGMRELSELILEIFSYSKIPKSSCSKMTSVLTKAQHHLPAFLMNGFHLRKTRRNQVLMLPI